MTCREVGQHMRIIVTITLVCAATVLYTAGWVYIPGVFLHIHLGLLVVVGMLAAMAGLIVLFGWLTGKTSFCRGPK